MLGFVAIIWLALVLLCSGLVKRLDVLINMLRATMKVVSNMMSQEGSVCFMCMGTSFLICTQYYTPLVANKVL